MAEEDPLMQTTLSLSPGRSSLTSPTSRLMMTSPTQQQQQQASQLSRERHSSGELTSPSRLRRRTAPPANIKKGKKKKNNNKVKKSAKKSGREKGGQAAAERKAIYRSAVKRAAEGWKSRKETFAKQMGRTRRPDYYKPIKVSFDCVHSLSLAKFSKQWESLVFPKEEPRRSGSGGGPDVVEMTA